MDQSPPKRITRARAAAKTDTGAGIKTTKVATAAAKAKLTRSVSTTKRRTRADDEHQDEEQPQPEEIIEPEPKPTRGRPKRAAQPETMQEEVPAPAPARATRGRPKKVIAETPAHAPEPTRTTRGRKKTEVEEEPLVDVEPVKRPTRARATTVTKTAAPKKSVKFEEPDKENIVPTVAKDNKIKVAETATGLRAKPVRKPAAATRATRGRAKVEEKEEKSSPLSPKKPTQVTMSKESTSDDELATTEKTPMRPLMKSPIKPAGNILSSVKKPDFTTSLTVSRATTSGQQDFKHSIAASPARRPPPSPFKESLKSSLQTLPLGGPPLSSPFKLSSKPTNTASPFKTSLLASPARRAQSPTKVSEAGSPTRSTNNASIFAATPKASTFKISRFATPRTLTKSVSRPGMMLPPALPSSIEVDSPTPAESSDLPVESGISFSGRLSSIVPREVDVPFSPMKPTMEEESEIQQSVAVAQEEPQMSAEQPDTIVVDDEMDIETTTPPASPFQQETDGIVPEAFAFRETNDDPFADSDSEDELASDNSPIPMTGFKVPLLRGSSPVTPAPFVSIAKTPKTVSQRSSMKSRNQIGFTPLAKQLSDWMAASPAKSDRSVSDEEHNPLAPRQAEIENTVETSPIKSTFFEDEMSVRDELAEAPGLIRADSDLMENFEPVEVEEEDLALALEADEMSLLEPAEIEDLVSEGAFEGEGSTPEDQFQAENPPSEEQPEIEPITFDEGLQVEQLSFEEALQADEPHFEEVVQPVELVFDEMMHADEPAPSESSQEYGDENAIPIDPALLAIPISGPSAFQARSNFATPKRVLSERTVHTVYKVPLKAAAQDTPMRPSPKKRSASISRLPAQRPTSTLSRNNTVISYSPTKSTPRRQSTKQSVDIQMQDIVVTPSKGEDAEWSNLGTPARTPRRDLNTALLKGAVVFVDVYTSEGADASVLFTELLSQMGARCVKSWAWNGNSEDKIGITHVVFKDGGKRTLEKVRETNGVVSCVGVGWVLDCERENKWLDETPYSVDTAMIPRGGHKRRKSMEPRALANLNGTLVPSSSSTTSRKSYANMSPTKEFLSFPDTPVTNKTRRRESVQWVHSPSTSSLDNMRDDDQTLMLSPVPATPAPETISAYGEDGLYGDETPGGQTPYFLKEMLVQQTAPVSKFVDPGRMGAGFLEEKKDESVMMRLMAARRKSLQWAPKVGSPLARERLF